MQSISFLFSVMDCVAALAMTIHVGAASSRDSSTRFLNAIPYNSSIPRFANSSAFSFPATPVCPRTQNQSILCRVIASSSAHQRSLFFTGFLLDVFQPRFFQFGIH